MEGGSPSACRACVADHVNYRLGSVENYSRSVDKEIDDSAALGTLIGSCWALDCSRYNFLPNWWGKVALAIVVAIIRLTGACGERPRAGAADAQRLDGEVVDAAGEQWK